MFDVPESLMPRLHDDAEVPLMVLLLPETLMR
jgi:hypothetical protein